MAAAAKNAPAAPPRAAKAASGRERNPIIERLLGDTGEPDRILRAAESMAGRALAQIADALAPRFSFVPDMEVEAVDLVRFAEVMPGERSLDTVVVAPGASSPDALTLHADVDAISILVQAAFGGDRDVAAFRLKRALSPIERQIVSGLFDSAARALNGSGSRSLEIGFPLPEPQSAAEFAKTPARDGPAARIVFRIALGQASGRLTALVPQRVLVERRSDEGGANAGQWRARLNEEVMRSSVRLEAAIPLPKISLGEVAGWRVGEVIEFPAGAHAETLLSARRKPLFECEFGRLGNHFTVRVKQPFDAAQDFIDGLTRR